MQTKHLCVLIHIWTMGEVGAQWNRFKPCSKIFFLTILIRCFLCGSFMVYLSCYAPAMIMAGALSVRPSVLYVRTYFTYVGTSRWRRLSKSYTFDQNFMKFGRIVKYHNVFVKFDNGLYRTRLSVVMALCLWKITVLNDVRSLTRIFFTRILWNLVTLFSIIMSSSSSIMVYIAPGFQ